MDRIIKLKKGLDIRLTGEADKVCINMPLADTYAIKPPDFLGVVPKLKVKEGDEVMAGTPLFYMKGNEDIVFASPVSGEVIEVKRGEKRRILELRILCDKEIRFKKFESKDPDKSSKEEITKSLLESGLWPFIRQRPFGIIANPAETPKAIFISAFDTAPLAPDNDFILHGQGKAFQSGLNAIAKLTSGMVHLNIDPNKTLSKVFLNSQKVQINRFSGPHPAGNVGIQIHHLDPINKGEVVWYLYPQDVINIGTFFLDGKVDLSRIIALAGSEIAKPRYHKVVLGTAVKSLLENNLNSENIRVISGSVLTGSQIDQDGYLGFYDTQLTLIPEGDKQEFLGWIAPGLDKFSMSRTFFSWLQKHTEYSLTTNMNGENRAFVITGQYERVLPMDIYPLHLLKSILIDDIEMMENLGIYEVVEEDFALCEFVCTSKADVQAILRRGLEQVRKECF